MSGWLVQGLIAPWYWLPKAIGVDADRESLWRSRREVSALILKV